MKVVGLDGRIHNWVLSNNESTNPSKPHIIARKLLRELFPLEQRLEELTLPGTSGLAADFFIPGQSLLIEVQGEQHYKFSLHFHKDKAGYARSLIRDRNKRTWCELNHIQFVELPYNEVESWTARILKVDS